MLRYWVFKRLSLTLPLLKQLGYFKTFSITIILYTSTTVIKTRKHFQTVHHQAYRVEVLATPLQLRTSSLTHSTYPLIRLLYYQPTPRLYLVSNNATLQSVLLRATNSIVYGRHLVLVSLLLFLHLKYLILLLSGSCQLYLRYSLTLLSDSTQIPLSLVN